MNKERIIQYLREHKTDFSKEYGVKKIGIFGSYARDDNYEGSDLDIVVELEKPDLIYLIGIKKTIEEQLRIKVDIVRLRDRMNKILKKRIEKDAVFV